MSWRKHIYVYKLWRLYYSWKFSQVEIPMTRPDLYRKKKCNKSIVYFFVFKSTIDWLFIDHSTYRIRWFRSISICIHISWQFFTDILSKLHANNSKKVQMEEVSQSWCWYKTKNDYILKIVEVSICVVLRLFFRTPCILL